MEVNNLYQKCIIIEGKVLKNTGLPVVRPHGMNLKSPTKIQLESGRFPRHSQEFLPVSPKNLNRNVFFGKRKTSRFKEAKRILDKSEFVSSPSMVFEEKQPWEAIVDSIIWSNKFEMFKNYYGGIKGSVTKNGYQY